MKKLFIVANWKSNKTEIEANEWLQQFAINNLQLTDQKDKEVVICPPFTLLSPLKSLIINHKSLIHLGGQDISPFDEGAYTGEVNGRQIKEFADYVIIGHSERRSHFGETDEIIDRKVQQAVKFGLTSILCVQDEYTPIPSGVTIVAYEPPSSIGNGNPDDPQHVEEIVKKIKENQAIQYVLYGGSVNEENVSTFTQMPHINGILVGGASLQCGKFVSIINHA